MNDQMKISYEPIASKGRLVLHVSFARGAQQLYDGVILAEESEEVIRLTNEVSRATGISLTEVEQQLTGVVLEARSWWKKAKQSRQGDEGFQANFLNSAELERLDVRHRWLIKNILVRDQPALLGGPKKSLKTSIMLDMAISLGTGKPFLGRFDIPEKVRVAVLSGESGQSTIKETAVQIARAKGVPLGACDVLWGFDLPRLGVEEDLRALAAALRQEKVAVVFLDPAYLCLLSGNPDLQASNLFQVGPLLLAVSRVCLEVGATLVLVHHSTKPSGMLRMQAGEPLELEDLAFSGFAEFARQWVLVNRRVKYEPGSGKHCLWMNIGGSAGHSGCWGVNVDEGKLAEDFTGRRWLVQVQPMDVALKEIAQSKKSKKDADKEAKEEDVKRRVLQVLSGLDEGETVSGIVKLTGIDKRWVAPALSDLAQERRVALCDIVKGSGRNSTKAYPGFKLAYPMGTVDKARRIAQERAGGLEEGNDTIEADKRADGARSAQEGQAAVGGLESAGILVD
jgi:replicative DNA helicase